MKSILEQSAVVWHSSLTAKKEPYLERVQENEVRVILGQQFSYYKDGLQRLNLQSLNVKNSNETQAPQIFFFTLLVMLGNYEPTCIVTIKMVTM